MALTTFEKSMLQEIHDKISQKPKSLRTAADQEILDTIIGGTESAQQAIIVAWINDVGITDIDSQITALNDRVTELEARKTEMENYVA